MCKSCESILIHNHTAKGSNLRLRDSTNTVEGLIQTTYEMGHKGLAITEHEAICSHVRALKYVQSMKEKGKLPEDFKLILGNEIYLVDSLEEVRDNYQGGGVTKFPHFLILAKDEIGHEQIRRMSSQAWKNSFQTGLMLRTPTEKSYLAEIIKEDPNHLIASTACLGSEICIRLMEMKLALEENNQNKANLAYKKGCQFIEWCVSVFGKEDFYLELQPAYSEEQIYCNKELLKLADKYELKYVITTDSHYYRPEDRIVHKAFLNSKEGEREVDAFYEATFIQNHEEIQERLSYLDHSIVKEALLNTVEIGNKIKDYTILKTPVIPKIDIPEFELSGFFEGVYDKYEYLEKVANSKNQQDRYLLKLIEDGIFKYIPFNTYSKDKMHEIAHRLNEELKELWLISAELSQNMSSYYVTIKKIVDLIWSDECGDSFVGTSRGSAAGFLTCFLLGITQINPLEFEIDLPHWRHIHHSRPDLPDIDLDSQANKREQIIRGLKDYFGEDRVLQVCTFGTEASKSAVQTSARGLGIDNDTAMYVSGLIPFERGASWELKDCVYGNEEKDRKKVTEFINEINKHANWLNVAMKIEGLENKRSIHASGVIIFNEEYYKTNALMTAPNGSYVTQLSLEDCEAVSNVKFDLLTVEILDKMRVTFDNLLKDNLIEWQGTLRNTYEKYLHPSSFDLNNPELYDLIASGQIVDLFQFSTDIGINTVKQVKPTTLVELASANSLMRLMGDGSVNPIDTFVSYKRNIEKWYEEMKDHELNEDEVAILENYLLPLNGVADTQESVMLLSMDEKIAGFDVKEANKLRKVIAKKKARDIEDLKKLFYEKGLNKNNRKIILDYVWTVQIVRQLGYSFSVLHTMGYSIMALQNALLNLRYDPIYWQTACLTVNSASNSEDEDEDSKNQSTNYGKIAMAISDIRSRGVKIGLPDINQASFGFTPDTINKQIIFGLKGINGIGDEIAFSIIKNRPYNNFDDFYEKMFVTKIVKKSQLIKLIKAGCFDSFGERKDIMTKFLESTFEKKSKLTLANISGLIELDLVPDDVVNDVKIYNFKKYLTNFPYKIEGVKSKLYLNNSETKEFFEKNFSDDCVYDYLDGFQIVKNSKFEKECEEKMTGLRNWLGDEQTLKSYNDILFQIEWDNYADGTISSWEMDSLSFYYNEHELEHLQKEKYNIVSYLKLPEEPVVTEIMKFRNGERPKFKLDYIVGTVLDKNKNKHTVSLLTPDGVVIVKYYDGAFANYNQQVSKTKPDGSKQIVEKSWFTRGNKIVIQGYRRGNQFKPHKYKDSLSQHTTMLITKITSDGDIKIKREREKGARDEETTN